MCFSLIHCSLESTNSVTSNRTNHKDNFPSYLSQLICLSCCVSPADNKTCSKLRSFAEAQVLRSVPGRYNRHCISPQSLYSREAPNHRSLQSEMQDMQQVGSAGGPQGCLFMVLTFCFTLPSSSAAASQSAGRHRPPVPAHTR